MKKLVDMGDNILALYAELKNKEESGKLDEAGRAELQELRSYFTDTK